MDHAIATGLEKARRARVELLIHGGTAKSLSEALLATIRATSRVDLLPSLRAPFAGCE
ncbi:hypothetical protein [Cupriavidus sp. AcVe19-1a]|uniref:hypothetical protein n=1 Tax=unclassified Cupriavidus TaxID=2640874 RepID=UPI0032AF6A0E